MAKKGKLEDDMLIPEMSFKQMYPNPVIHNRYKSRIKGVEVWQVYDKSHLVADPVPMSNWIVAGKKKFRADNEGVPKALAYIKFDPKTKAQAKEAALLRFRADGDYTLLIKKPYPPVDAPTEGLVEPLKVEKKGDRFIVTFYVYTCATRARWFGQDIRSVDRYTAEVGKDHFYMRMPETVWAAEPMPGFEGTPKLVRLTKPKK